MNTHQEDEGRLPPPPAVRGRDQAVWVGLFLILGLAAILGTLLVLTDAAMFRGRYVVTTRVPSAGGMRKGDPVQMRGVNIGRVIGFEIEGEGVAVRLEIEGEYAIPADSRVELRSAGLFGGFVADVSPGRSREHLRYGDTLPGSSEEPLLDLADRIAVRVEAVVGRMEALLSLETIENVREGTGEARDLLRQVSKAVSEQRRELSGLVASLRRSSQGLERVTTGPELTRVLERLDRMTARLDAAARSTQTVLQRVERGEGTLGRMTRDDDLYENLQGAIASLNRSAVRLDETLAEVDRLAEDIRRNPKRYVKFSLF